MKHQSIDFIVTEENLISCLSEVWNEHYQIEWRRFYSVYYNPMIAFVKHLGVKTNCDDVVQKVMSQLVDILSQHKYVRQEGMTFRGYLKKMLLNEAYNYFRSEKTRLFHYQVVADQQTDVCSSAEIETLDAAWCYAVHKTAVDHVFSSMRLPLQDQMIYRNCIEGKILAADVARELKISRSAVSQKLKGIRKLIEKIERFYGTLDERNLK